MSLETYKNRVDGSIGSSLKDYVKKQVRTNLDTYLEKSQYGMDVEIEGKQERIGIMTGSMTDTRDEVLVLSKFGVLNIGSLFKWDDEFWIVTRRQARVIKESFYGTAYRCNVDLKWVDKEGSLFSQKAYAKGRGMSSILVENKYLEPPVISREVDTPITVITQRNPLLKQDMRFLFEGIPYRVTFIDNLSIDGATILGMYDDILQEDDDVVNNIANYRSKYAIKLDFGTDLTLSLGTEFEVNYTVLESGTAIADKDVVLIGDPEKVKIEGMKITPLVEEDIPLRLAFVGNELIGVDFVVHSGVEWVEENVFIVGRDEIGWGNNATYNLNTQEEAEFILDWSGAPKVKHSEVVTDNSITITVQDKYSGTVKLIVMTGTEIIEKEIKIVAMEAD